jgi:hypothetical protein
MGEWRAVGHGGMEGDGAWGNGKWEHAPHAHAQQAHKPKLLEYFELHKTQRHSEISGVARTAGSHDSTSPLFRRPAPTSTSTPWPPGPPANVGDYGYVPWRGLLDCPEAKLDEEWCFIIWGGLLGPGIAVVNPQSGTLKLGKGATVSYTMRGALVRGSMQPTGAGLPRVPHVRGWLKAWARANGRGGKVDAVEEWEQQQRQRLAGVLQLTPAEGRQLEVPLDEDH